MGASSFFSPSGRLGMHYFPDTYHYRDADLQTWLPELQALGVSWLVLRSDLDRAVPEPFLRGMAQAGIQPVIQFPLGLEGLPERREVETLLSVYARWGARSVVFFDRPNARSAWPAAAWLQQDLVERFLDRFLPLAGLALQTGLAPIFPPLEPGGSYWDTTFLRSALLAMLRRKQEALLNRLVLSAYAWTGGHSLDWGAGGPERWPEARPYLTPRGSQDQRGFRVFDWYASVARSVLNRDLPVMLFQAGQAGDPVLQVALAAAQEAEERAADVETQADVSLAIARLLDGEETPDPLAPENQLDPIPAQVVSCNFWLPGVEAGSLISGPAAEKLRRWRSGRKSRQARVEEVINGPAVPVTAGPAARPIRHYLLLPGQETGISDWYLEIIRPFVKKHRPTVGFSVDEAARAELVTMIGPERNYPEGTIDRLAESGCSVEPIRGTGTEIATILAER